MCQVSFKLAFYTKVSQRASMALWNVSGAPRTLATHLSEVPSDSRARTRPLGGNGYNQTASTRVNGRYIGHCGFCLMWTVLLSDAPVESTARSNGYLSFGGSIKMCWAALAHSLRIVKHWYTLVSLVKYLPLISFIDSSSKWDCEWSIVHLLKVWASSATSDRVIELRDSCYSWWLPTPRRLSAVELLSGGWWLSPASIVVIVRGSCAFPAKDS
jgi:hypothetical protein